MNAPKHRRPSLSPEARARIMRSITKTNTKPELIVRRICHSLGFRFRLHQRTLPGTPDLSFPRLRKIILVHGCFWHQHKRCRLAKQPQTRREYWIPKLARNIKRDASSRRALRALGWATLVVWECETRDTDALQVRLVRFLGR